MAIQYMYTQVIKKIKNLPTSLYIFLFAFLYRLPSLGIDFINNDAFLWKSRSYEFGKALMSLDFAGTAVTYHPGISLFMFISCLYFYIAFSKDGSINKTGKEAILSGVFMGLAALTKSSALFLIPFYALGYLILRKFDFSEIKKLLIVYLFFILSFFAFWPAMWVNPVGSISLYLFKGVEGVALEEGHGHIWFGIETLDPGPLFFPLVFATRYSMFIVLMFIFGFYFSIKNYKN